MSPCEQNGWISGWGMSWPTLQSHFLPFLSIHTLKDIFDDSKWKMSHSSWRRPISLTSLSGKSLEQILMETVQAHKEQEGVLGTVSMNLLVQTVPNQPDCFSVMIWLALWAFEELWVLFPLLLGRVWIWSPLVFLEPNWSNQSITLIGKSTFDR